MAWHLFGTKPSHGPLLTCNELHPLEQFQKDVNHNNTIFIWDNVFENICKTVAILSQYDSISYRFSMANTISD